MNDMSGISRIPINLESTCSTLSMAMARDLTGKLNILATTLAVQQVSNAKKSSFFVPAAHKEISQVSEKYFFAARQRTRC